MSSSLKMLVNFQQAGVLSKEAATDVLRKREDLLKVAMEKQGSLLSDLAKKIRPAPPPPPEGFLSKLRSGGMTGGNERGWSDVAANMGKLLALAGLTAGTLTGADLGAEYIRNRRRDAALGRSFEEVSQHPDIVDWKANHGYTDEDVQRNFNILSRYAPSLAVEPSVATSILSQAALEKGMNTMADPARVEMLARIQGTISKARKDEKGQSMVRPMDFIAPSVGL